MIPITTVRGPLKLHDDTDHPELLSAQSAILSSQTKVQIVTLFIRNINLKQGVNFLKFQDIILIIKI